MATAKPIPTKIEGPKVDYPVSDDIIVNKEEMVPMKAHKEVVEGFEKKIEELKLVITKYEKVITDLNSEIEELKATPLEVEKEEKEQAEANFKKAQKERKLNKAVDVMDWFGLTIFDVKKTKKLTDMGLTKREIELLELEYSSKLKKNLAHLSAGSVDAEIKEIMFKYGITLAILKDEKALGELEMTKGEMTKIKKFITKILS